MKDITQGAESQTPVDGIRITAPLSEEFSRILTTEALTFLRTLSRRYSKRRDELLAKRSQRQMEFDEGKTPGFLEETEPIRKSDWTVDPVPADLQKRHVEITGPSGDTKMVINAFNSGADMYMADFEDSQSPTWNNTIQGQINIRDAIDGTISYVSPEGKQYRLGPKVSTLIVRPRGWHLLENHVLIDGLPVSGSLFDYSMFLFHNAKKLVAKGSGPYLYLPKIESYLEARLWNDIFSFSEEELGLPHGVIKATVLIETITAAFEMDEILYELRERSAGLNCGRWDYIFSFIKKFRNRKDLILPDRSQVTMDRAFLAAYVDLSIKTCHRRNAHSIGGMSAYIPVKDEQANKVAMEKVRADKEREVRAGHDGTWVAHPGLVPLAREIFATIGGPHQISKKREDVNVTPADLMKVPDGDITEGGVRTNISVGVLYLEAWLRGKGSVPINNLMEDAATAEICRAQLWQWIRHVGKTKDGVSVTVELFRSMMREELERIRGQLGEEGYGRSQIPTASELFEIMSTDKEFPEFLTFPAYERLLLLENRGLVK